ncbi:NAD(P)-binding protein [Pseudoalteromonas viridis]|uniref:FAD-dependent oxidoreductase n=1 Tax=Pseudoalteromonas viridis TaxID=339617 RepID=A0ABX7V021_9GAMM|nr:NAD(P)-binding protein [Pseudoalteromonas viridis]QTL34228.1 FAD-dependent oxidoreductase [Pseudoalteromonas viridis]
MKQAVVVGGGVCGLVAAYLLSKHFEQVILIEQSERCGGLLNSVHDASGIYYDQGTHIPNPTGVDELDDFLFSLPTQAPDFNWINIPELRTGNYFRGQWDLETQTIDARKLPVHLYHQGVGQLMSCTSEPGGQDIKSYCEDFIGELFFEHLVKPVIDKLYGEQEDYESLTARNSVNYFGATRLLALDPTTTAQLKQLPIFDMKLGYHSRQAYQERLAQDNIPEPHYLYPDSEKGVQAWVDLLVNKIEKAGVRIVTGQQITAMNQEGNRISQVSLGEQEVLDCDFIYWSAPPVFALKLLGDYTSTSRPRFRTANIFHYTFDKPISNTQSHYLWVWDPETPIFRITLYGNINSARANSLSAEVLSDKEEAVSIGDEQILADLIKMGLIDASARVVSNTRQIIHHTFPVPTFDFQQNVTSQYEQLHQQADNLVISGRFSGHYWLLNDILNNTYESINALFGKQ